MKGHTVRAGVGWVLPYPGPVRRLSPLCSTRNRAQRYGRENQSRNHLSSASAEPPGYFTCPVGLLYVWKEVEEEACSHFGPHFKPVKLLRSPGERRQAGQGDAA